MTKMMRLEMDVAWNDWDETLADVLEELKRECGAESRVLVENGPAGGWPIVEFVVSAEKLADLVERLGYGDDEEQMKMFVESAEEVSAG